jgi:hypothetical protein
MKQKIPKKKKATKKELEKLREAFIEIWNDPVAMRQAKKIASAA